MAAEDKGQPVVLTREERMMVLNALELQRKSLVRAVSSEKSAVVKAARTDQIGELDTLCVKFR